MTALESARLGLGANIRAIRVARGRTQADLADAAGVTRSSVSQWESGLTAPSFESIVEIAAYLNVSREALFRAKPVEAIPLLGLVGAGAKIDWRDESAFQEEDSIDLPGDGHLGALRIVGDSQWPRFLEGETVLFDTRPELPERLLDDYAIVQTFEGDRLLKILRRGAAPGLFVLESHNAPPMRATRLIMAHRYLGVLATSDRQKPRGRRR